MIAKISRGWRVAGLVHYLMGPGRFNEHINQHVVASWDGAPELHQPELIGDGNFDVEELATDLADPAVAAGIPQTEPIRLDGGKAPRGPVWHCSLRNSAGDRVLIDAEWAEIATDLMDRTGIAPRDDLGACRWVAIRHTDSHVHIAAVLVRQDNGRRVHPYKDYPKAREVCRDAEARLGLTATAPVDRTAAKPATRAEMEKAVRRGLDETSREWLCRAARIAAVQARDPEQFFRRLFDLGVRVRPRARHAGQLAGYSVAAPGDETAEGLPVWYSGRALSPDLSLPQLLKRWASAPPPGPPIAPAPGERSQVGRAELEAAAGDALAALEQATSTVAAGEDDEVPGIAHAAGDMFTAVGAVTQHGGHGQMVPRDAADLFDRASRTPMVGQPDRLSPVAAALRTAAWRLVAVRSLSGRTGQDSAGAQLVLALAALVAEIAAYRERQGCVVQASSARRSAQILRASRGAGRASGAADGRLGRGDGPGRRPVSTPRPAPTVVHPRPGDQDDRGRKR
ncbi:relaxase/mobilization nuclease domain-containing protein [Pseudonocardia alaniniphila]|uniref:Relaxase/mobilization nuclease domain-containing protein n=1 Tax=Pseudonocardia alaniniphila TaxID=75291 RepID=A0ABS9TB94_9PSEU|nr:relaxase/mobilization nuclease domain-containing protein [Pseudonocardia alaniniphila]MCH6165673.1 relaxase/mobilization nuclease domain-containing protein [Pseudonocardia alaniniphila]